MSDLKKEQISALLDNESESEQGPQFLCEDRELRQAWGRYQLISDCIRRNVPDSIDPGLAGRISRAIDSEPAMLLPVKREISHFIKPVAGFALAASVATVAILGIQQNLPKESGFTPQVARGAAPNVIPQIAQASLDSADSSLRKEQMNSRLNRYLVNYNEYRTHAGMQGMLPYVRVVAHGKDK